MDMLLIRFLTFVSVSVLRRKLFHDSSYRQKVAGDINSLNLLIFYAFLLSADYYQN